jgi:hypothetical protein
MKYSRASMYVYVKTDISFKSKGPKLWRSVNLRDCKAILPEVYINMCI